jgi:hypothetical protein
MNDDTTNADADPCPDCEGAGSHNRDEDGYAVERFCACDVGQAALDKHLDDLGIPRSMR